MRFRCGVGQRRRTSASLMNARALKPFAQFSFQASLYLLLG